jgi:hypothetical protein
LEIASIGRTRSPRGAVLARTLHFVTLSRTLQKRTVHKMGFSVFSPLLLETFFLSYEYLASCARDELRNVCKSLCKVPVIALRFYRKLKCAGECYYSFQCHLS